MFGFICLMCLAMESYFEHNNWLKAPKIWPVSLSFSEFSKTNASLPLKYFWYDMFYENSTIDQRQPNPLQQPRSLLSLTLPCLFPSSSGFFLSLLVFRSFLFLVFFYLTYLPYACCFIYIGLVLIYSFIYLFYTFICLMRVLLYGFSIIIIITILLLLLLFWVFGFICLKRFLLLLLVLSRSNNSMSLM